VFPLANSIQPQWPGVWLHPVYSAHPVGICQVSFRQKPVLR